METKRKAIKFVLTRRVLAWVTGLAPLGALCWVK
jgi:hypothetical protein